MHLFTPFKLFRGYVFLKFIKYIRRESLHVVLSTRKTHPTRITEGRVLISYFRPSLPLKYHLCELFVQESVHQFQLWVSEFCTTVIHKNHATSLSHKMKTPERGFLCNGILLYSFCSLFKVNFLLNTLRTSHEEFESSTSFRSFLIV